MRYSEARKVNRDIARDHCIHIHTCKWLHSYTYIPPHMRTCTQTCMGRSQKQCTTFVTWKRKMKTFQTIAENIPSSRRFHILLMAYMLCRDFLFFTLWFWYIYIYMYIYIYTQIEKAVKINHVTFSHSIILTHINITSF